MIEFIQKVRETLWNSVDALSDEELNQVVEEGTWSIKQVLEHLHKLDKVVAKVIETELNNVDSQPSNEKPVHLSTNRKKKIKAPSYLTPTNEFIPLAEMKNKLHRSRESLLKVIDGIDEEALNNKSFKHPIFGQLNLKQWVEFIGFHEQRHIEQIEEVKQKLSNEKVE